MESWAKLVSDEYDRRMENPDHAVNECQKKRSHLTDRLCMSSSSVSANNFGHDSRNGHRFPELMSASKVFKKLKEKIDDAANYLIF